MKYGLICSPDVDVIVGMFIGCDLIRKRVRVGKGGNGRVQGRDDQLQTVRRVTTDVNGAIGAVSRSPAS